jgi:hypothetical protein
VINEFIVLAATSAAVAPVPVSCATYASNTLILYESTSNAARTYIFLMRSGGAFFYLSSYAIVARILADSVFLLAFLNNSTASIFLFFSIK